MAWESFKIYDTYIQDLTTGNYTIGDVHLADYNVYIGRGKGGLWEEILVPDSEDYTEKIMGRDGELFFGTSFKARKIKIECFVDGIDENTRRYLQQILTMRTPKKISRDDYDYKYIWAKTDGQINFQLVKQGGLYKGFIELNLIAYDPFYYSFYNSLEEYKYDNPNLFYDAGFLHVELMPPTTLNNITGNKTFQLYNGGNYNSKMIITITGTGENIVITNISTEQQCTISAINGQTIIIDGIKGMVTSADVLYNNAFDGDFLELKPQFNNLMIQGTNLNLSQVSFSYRFTYL